MVAKGLFQLNIVNRMTSRRQHDEVSKEILAQILRISRALQLCLPNKDDKDDNDSLTRARFFSSFQDY